MTVLVVALLIVGALVVAGLAAAGWVAWTVRARLDRSLRLVPGQRVDVPWSWRWSVRRAPLLHRRLQRSCQIVLAATGGAPTYRRARLRWGRRAEEQETSILQTTGRSLLDQAVNIDLRLVGADRGGAAWRRIHLPAIADDVAGLEASCLRLAQLSAAFDDHLDAVTGRRSDSSGRTGNLLDAMEAAIADLRAEEAEEQAAEG
jgi:hypothetical protein